MPGGFPKVKYKDLAKALKKLGYVKVRTRGDHSRWEREDGTRPITILEGKSNMMISRTIWTGLKLQLGEENIKRLRKLL